MARIRAFTIPEISRLVCALIVGATTASALAQGDAGELADELLRVNPPLTPEAEAAIRTAYEQALTSASIGTESLSQTRQDQVNQLVRAVAQQFPTGDYDTPLQRRATLAAFEANLNSVIQTPTFSAVQVDVIGKQSVMIADAVKEVATSLYPDIVASPIEQRLVSSVRDQIGRAVANDSTPAFKTPLPEAEFQDTLQEMVKNALESTPLGLFPNGHFRPNWEQMTAEEQATYLETNADHLSQTVLGSIAGALTIVRDASARHTVLSRYSDIQPSLAEKDQKKELAALMEDARIEARQIKQRLETQRRDETVRQRIQDKIDVEIGVLDIEGSEEEALDSIEQTAMADAPDKQPGLVRKLYATSTPQDDTAADRSANDSSPNAIKPTGGIGLGAITAIVATALLGLSFALYRRFAARPTP